MFRRNYFLFITRNKIFLEVKETDLLFTLFLDAHCTTFRPPLLDEGIQFSLAFLSPSAKAMFTKSNVTMAIVITPTHGNLFHSSAFIIECNARSALKSIINE